MVSLTNTNSGGSDTVRGNMKLAVYMALAEHSALQKEGQGDWKTRELEAVKQKLFEELSRYEPKEQLKLLDFVMQSGGELGKIAEERHKFVSVKLEELEVLTKQLQAEEREELRGAKLMMDGIITLASGVLSCASVIGLIPGLKLIAAGTAMMIAGKAIVGKAQEKMGDLQIQRSRLQADLGVKANRDLEEGVATINGRLSQAAIQDGHLRAANEQFASIVKMGKW